MRWYNLTRMMRFRIEISIPALDRLIDFLEGNQSEQQKQIDDLAERLRVANAALSAALAAAQTKSGE